MGTVLGDAIRQRERIDECEAILTSLTDLGAAHVRVLELLVQQPPTPPSDEPPFWSRQTIGAAANRLFVIERGR